MAIAAIRQDASAPISATPQIAFADVTLELGGKTIIENLSLGVRPGEFLCIVGASGCGKTTALRLAAGLYQPTRGKVNFDGQPMRHPRREIAIVCVLLLRGPQTPGELRGRTERMFRFETLDDVQSAIQKLTDRQPSLVRVLPRQPGTKESRYMHLFSGDVADSSPAAAAPCEASR